MTRAGLLRDAAMLRACTCGAVDHEWLAAELEAQAARVVEPEPAAPAGVCVHGCCPDAVCAYVNDCAHHGGVA